jgi:hypothetical protein
MYVLLVSPEPRLNSTSAAFARASAAPMVKYRGIIAVTNTANGQILGYISKNSFNFAQYRYQPTLDDALIVSFSIDSGVTVVNDVRITSEVSALSHLALPILTFNRRWNRTPIPQAFLFCLWFKAGMTPLSISHRVPSSMSPASVA